MMRSARILVVAGEVSARTSVVTSLRAQGYDVEVAADAASAHTNSPHVVVLDSELGLELVSQLRSGGLPPAVVVLTASGASSVPALRAGAIACVTKPLDIEELQLVIDRVVEHEQLARENRDLRARIAEVMTTGMPVVPGARLDEIERYVILETLKYTRGSTSKAAEMLGISVRTIQYRLHEYNAASRSRMSVVANQESPAAAVASK